MKILKLDKSAKNNWNFSYENLYMFHAFVFPSLSLVHISNQSFDPLEKIHQKIENIKIFTVKLLRTKR